MPERLNGTVSNTVVLATAPWVRIPLSPPIKKSCGKSHRIFILNGCQMKFEQTQLNFLLFQIKVRNGFISNIENFALIFFSGTFDRY
jgi:hypothetical protein